MSLLSGRERSPVGRPVFKTGRGRQTVLGGFDSHSLPPTFLATTLLTMPHKPYQGAVPDGYLYDCNYDMWVKCDGEAVIVGITRFGVFMAGEIITFTGKPKGAIVDYGRGLGTVESAKTVLAVHSPLSLILHEVNEGLEERPAPINADPHLAWLIRGTPADWETESQQLVDADAYRRHILSVEPEACFE